MPYNLLLKELINMLFKNIFFGKFIKIKKFFKKCNCQSLNWIFIELQNWSWKRFFCHLLGNFLIVVIQGNGGGSPFPVFFLPSCSRSPLVLEPSLIFSNLEHKNLQKQFSINFLPLLVKDRKNRVLSFLRM